MSNRVLGFLRHAVAGVALCAATGLASASAVFSFTFNNEDGSVAGSVSGTVELPDGDGTFAALNLIITSAPAALAQAVPVDLADFAQIDENTFTVVGGAVNVAASHFFGIFPGFNSAFALNGTAFGAGGRSFLDQQPVAFLGEPGTLDRDSSSLRFAAVVPAPGSLAVLGLGLAALGVMRRRAPVLLPARVG